jgi:hypothetical protein
MFSITPDNISNEVGSVKSVLSWEQAFPHGHHRASLSQLSATTELLVIDLVMQQDPESDPQLACGGYFRFPQTFLYQLVLIKRCNSASLRTACPTASPAISPVFLSEDWYENC